MKEGDKVWIAPELIVLARNKPEEAVLEACKGLGEGPISINTGCINDPGCATDCISNLPS